MLIIPPIYPLRPLPAFRIASSILCAALLLPLGLLPATAQEYTVRNVSFDVREYGGWQLPDLLPYRDMEGLVDRELLFVEGDYYFDDITAESARNLLASGLFRRVETRRDTLGGKGIAIHYMLERAPALHFRPAVASGGGAESFGLYLHSPALLTPDIGLEAGAMHRSENDAGTQAYGRLQIANIGGMPWRISAEAEAHILRTRQEAVLEQYLHSTFDKLAFGLRGRNSFGAEFSYHLADSNVRSRFYRRSLEAWLTRAFYKEDRFMITAYLALNEAEHTNPLFRQAADNSGKFFLAFSSLAQDFSSTELPPANRAGTVPVGAWGTAVLGRIFPIGSTGDKLFYAGGRAQQAVRPGGNTYLYGSITAGSGFSGSRARYTYQEFYGLGHWQAAEALILAARLRQQTAWNWPAFRDLVLDNAAGLRGYAVNGLRGHNRILASVELRYLPGLAFGGCRLETAAFYDGGMAWDQQRKLSSIKLHHALGAGVRLHHSLFGGNDILRLDAAYNTDSRKLDGIVLSTAWAFPLYGDFRFELPELFGGEIDTE